MKVSFPPCGKAFGAGDFCEPRLRLASAAVKDADKRAFKAEKINTGPRPAMSSFVAATQPPPTITAGCLLYFTTPCIARSRVSLERYQRSVRLALSNNDDLSATLLPREPVAFCFPFWHRRGDRQGPLPVRMRV